MKINLFVYILLNRWNVNEIGFVNNVMFLRMKLIGINV